MKKIFTRYAKNFNILISILLICTIYSWSKADTYVSGEVSGYWRLADSPFYVTDGIWIPQNEKLTIEPGVEVIILESDNEERNQSIAISVHGELRAIGTENDSIKFLGNYERFYGIVTPIDSLGARIHLEYCVINSSQYNVMSNYGRTTIRHCQLHAYTMFLSAFSDYCDTLEYNNLIGIDPEEHAGTISTRFSLGNNRFQNNYSPLLRVDIDNIFEPIIGNTVHVLGVDDSHCEITGNTIGGWIGLETGDYYLHDNSLQRLNNEGFAKVGAEFCDSVIVENETIGALGISESNYGEVRNNNILNNTIEGYNDALTGFGAIELVFEDNLLVSSETAMRLNNTSIQSMCNNTFFFSTSGISSQNAQNDGAVLFNNIFIGDGINDEAVHIRNGIFPLNIDYNCFYKTEVSSANLNIGENNLFSDPQIQTSEFSYNLSDYNLAASSPCIDAGDPDSPLDEDDTIADMGAFFYDQRLDNPPTITSPSYLTEHAGSYFSYTASAVDDYGPIEFTFENLPRGIEVITEELDWIADSTTVAGNIPVDIPGFTFTIIATDVIGQADTQYVYVDLEAMNILGGEISGILPSSGSPYLVVENLIIPEGDSLEVEPGTQLIFRYDPDPERRLKIDVYGKLLSLGTESDSIYYIPENELNSIRSWNGINYFNQQDTMMFSFSNLYYSDRGITLSEGTNLKLNHSSFRNNVFSIWANSENNISANNCTFNAFIDEGVSQAFYVFENSTLTIDSCIFHDSNDYGMFIRTRNSNAEIYNSTFINGRTGIYSNVESSLITRNCSFFNTLIGIAISNYSSGIITNNLFVNDCQDYSRGVMVDYTYAPIYNNIFVNQRTAIELSLYENEDDLPEIYNNVFIGNSKALFMYGNSYDLESFQYNCLFNNDTLAWNCTLNENNLLSDPLVSDSLTFYLFENSPCINAGNPAEEFYDIDGTRNDIGLYGGPYGRLYEYPIQVDENQSPEIFNLEIVNLYPNPFNSSQKLTFTISRNQNISISLYNCLGRLVTNYKNEFLQSGHHEILIDGNNLATGTYFVKISTKDQNRIIKTILIK